MSEIPQNWRELIRAGMGKTPFTASLGAEVLASRDDVARLSLPWSEKLIGDPATGIVHGGVITAMLDHCCGMAVGISLRKPPPYATLDLRIDYMKPAEPRREIFFEARCVKIGHEIAFTRGCAFQTTADDPIALCTGAFMFTGKGSLSALIPTDGPA
jgi:uncharacterized protein (TIGR00369 family)